MAASVKDNLDAITDLKDELFNIGEWCSNNLLVLNPAKTKFNDIWQQENVCKTAISLPFYLKSSLLVSRGNQHPCCQTLTRNQHFKLFKPEIDIF